MEALEALDGRFEMASDRPRFSKNKMQFDPL